MSLISARELSKHYPGVYALDNLTVDIESGIIGFVGANGAGKSTFIRILLGLLAPTSGTATVLGFDVEKDALEVRKIVGYMPEHDCLPLDISGTDFVAHMGQMAGLPFVAARERAAEMLRHVGLHEERYRLIGSYSTGMKQRIKLAQALVHDPKLLLLDEPTNGLDPEGRDEMLMLVERTGREFGIAVMVTSHLLGEIERVCNSLIAISAGKLQYAGSVSAFTQQTQRLRLELDDDVPEFAAGLRARGLNVEAVGAELHVDVVDESVYDVVRDVAAQLEAPLSRMEITRHKLEELFRESPPEPAVAEPRAAGAIYDLGYQRYTGQRLGRMYAIRALFVYSLRAAFGLSRGERAKSIPALCLALVYLTAFGQIAAASTTGRANLINYANLLEFTGFFVALFAAAQAPELIVADKQHGTLSLYLSRPILGADYAIAKLGALTTAMLVMTLGPQLVLFLGKVGIAASPWTELGNEKAKLLPIIGGTLMMSVFIASIGLALSSLASRRGYGSAAVIVFFLLMPALVTMFRTVTTGDLRRYAILANPVFLSLGFTQWLFEIEARRRSAVGRADLPGQLYLYVMLAASAICVAWLLRRYRRDHA